MFLNQARPANVLDDIKENILDWIPFNGPNEENGSGSANTEINPYALEAFAKRRYEIEHKRSALGTGLDTRR